MYVHIYIHTYIHTHMYTVHTYIHTYKPKSTYAHVYISFIAYKGHASMETEVLVFQKI